MRKMLYYLIVGDKFKNLKKLRLKTRFLDLYIVPVADYGGRIDS